MISILLPFRNAQDTLNACLASIRSQSFPYFEVIAINDHSTDESPMLVRNYPDQRIRCIDNQGKGLIPALNFGLSQCQHQLIARMDADDLMRPDRLKKQFAHFANTADLQLSATQVSLFPGETIKAGYMAYIDWQNKAVSPTDIANQIYVESPFAHPSVMFRKQTVVDLGGYQLGDFPEDYELWLRLFSKNLRLEKLPETLLDWRESPIRESRTNPRYRREAFDRLRAKYLLSDSRLSDDRPICIWGAGRKTRLRAKLLINSGIKPSAWVDIDPKKIGNTVNGIKIEPPEWLITDYEKPFVLIYVTNHGAREKIAHYLERIDYRVGMDYLCVG